jgi:CreA protein
MKLRLLAACCVASLCAIGTASAASPVEIGEVSTTFRMMGANDKVVVQRYDDPKVQNASCYVSFAQSGGVSSWVGMAENPSNFSIACRATGQIKITGNIDESINGEVVFSESQSIWFKTLRITRFHDKDKDTLVYLVWSTKLIDGSPFNSVTAIPIH